MKVGAMASSYLETDELRDEACAHRHRHDYFCRTVLMTLTDVGGSREMVLASLERRGFGSVPSPADVITRYLEYIFEIDFVVDSEGIVFTKKGQGHHLTLRDLPPAYRNLLIG
jgi:hypothetical protein